MKPLDAVKSSQEYKVLNRERYSGRGRPHYSDYDTINVPPRTVFFRKPKKDYSTHLVIVSLIALFLYFAFTGQLIGEMYVN